MHWFLHTPDGGGIRPARPVGASDRGEDTGALAALDLRAIAASAAEEVTRVEVPARDAAGRTPAGRGRLQIRVVDDAGVLLPGAAIRPHAPDGSQLPTVFGGRLTMNGLGPGTWAVHASAEGYLDDSQAVEISGQPAQQSVELRLRAASDLRVWIRARGRAESERPDEELVALLPLLAVRSSAPSAEAQGAEAPGSGALAVPRLLRDGAGRFRIGASLRRARLARARLELFAGSLSMDSTLAAGDEPEASLEIDLERARAELPSVEFAWRSGERVLRARLEALEGRCVLRGTVLEEGHGVRFGPCTPGPATLQAQLETGGWKSYAVELPERGDHRIALD